MKIIPGSRSLLFFVGPWCARLQWDRRSYGFAYFDTDSRLTRWLRRWWTGWHRWQDEA